MEESQSKPRLSRRLTSQPSLTPETKPFRAKRTRLNRSKSPGFFETCVSTSSETPVTPTIFGIPASIKEVPQLQEDIRIDPSVTVNTSIPKLAPSKYDPETKVHLPKHLEVEFQNLECVTPPVSITVEVIPSSALEIFYGPDGLPLPSRLVVIE